MMINLCSSTVQCPESIMHEMAKWLTAKLPVQFCINLSSALLKLIN